MACFPLILKDGFCNSLLTLLSASPNHPTSTAEVESEQAAANHSVLDVLEAFATLFGAQPFSSAAPAEEKVAGRAGGTSPGEQGDQPSQGWRELLLDVRGRVAAGQLLGAQPVLAMRALLAGVSPVHLQRDMERQLPAQQAAAAATAAAAAEPAAAAFEAATGDSSNDADRAVVQDRLLAATAAAGCSMPHHGLVSPKLAALVGQLMRYRSAAASSPPGTPGWCGIVFVTQRMAAWALHRMLRQAWPLPSAPHPPGSLGRPALHDHLGS